MHSSHWQKLNFHIREVGLSITVGLAILLALLTSMLRLVERSELIAVLVLVVGSAISIIVSDRYAKSKVRTLKYEYEEIERDFRFLFKAKHIPFNRRREECGYRYDFPGHGLNMTIEHYEVPDVHLQIMQSFTQVKLNEIDDENQAMADRLAMAIDEMVNQRKLHEGGRQPGHGC